MNEPVSRLERVRFSYPSKAGERGFAVGIEQLSIDAGQTTAVIGPSGCGKTTLINLMTGLLRPSEGEVWLAGRRLDTMHDAERRRERLLRVGMVFQEFELIDYLPAIDNIMLGAHLGGRGTRRDAADLADRLGIGALVNRRPRRLSQGERQRVAIARALLAAPPLLIADEPTGNLDPERADLTLDLLLGAARQRGSAVVVVTHDHDLLGRFDRVIDARTLAVTVAEPPAEAHA